MKLKTRGPRNPNSPNSLLLAAEMAAIAEKNNAVVSGKRSLKVNRHSGLKGVTEFLFTHKTLAKERWMRTGDARIARDIWERKEFCSSLAQYKALLKEKRPDIKVVGGNYETKASELTFECSLGHRWKTRAVHVLGTKGARSTGCPECFNARRGQTQCITQAEFILQASANVPTLKVIGAYIGKKTKIELECKVCEYRFARTASNVLKNQGCPQCLGASSPFETALYELLSTMPHISLTKTPAVKKDSLGRNVIKCSTRIHLYCSDHERHRASTMTSVLNKNKHCLCTMGTFDPSKPADVYLIPIYSKTHGEMLGYGITNARELRWKVHCKNLGDAGMTYGKPEWFPFANGFEAVAVEAQLRDSLPRPKGGIGVEGFITEVTYYTEIGRALKIVNTGGVYK